MSELRVHFHDELKNIEAKVIQLFALVGEDLAGATAALLDGDAVALTISTAKHNCGEPAKQYAQNF